MDRHLYEAASMLALAGLCAQPNAPVSLHATLGEPKKIVARAREMGKALAEQLEAERPEQAPAPAEDARGVAAGRTAVLQAAESAPVAPPEQPSAEGQPTTLPTTPTRKK